MPARMIPLSLLPSLPVPPPLPFTPSHPLSLPTSRLPLSLPLLLFLPIHLSLFSLLYFLFFPFPLLTSSPPLLPSLPPLSSPPPSSLIHSLSPSSLPPLSPFPSLSVRLSGFTSNVLVWLPSPRASGIAQTVYKRGRQRQTNNITTTTNSITMTNKYYLSQV